MKKIFLTLVLLMLCGSAWASFEDFSSWDFSWGGTVSHKQTSNFNYFFIDDTSQNWVTDSGLIWGC